MEHALSIESAFRRDTCDQENESYFMCNMITIHVVRDNITIVLGGIVDHIIVIVCLIEDGDA